MSINTLTSALTREYMPILMISVFKTVDERLYYLESHDINEQGQVMAGKPLQEETISEMVDVFFDARQNRVKIKGIAPENFLSFKDLPGGDYELTWYRPAEIRVMHHASTLKLPTQKTWVPAMVYQASGGGLDVYALASDKRPTESTKLYRAPFFNVNDDGDVCLGSARVEKPKERTYSNLMRYWEDLFWLSEFSHVNGTEKVRSKDLKAVWLKMLNSKTRKKWSDINELIPYPKKTLQSIL